LQVDIFAFIGVAGTAALRDVEPAVVVVDAFVLLVSLGIGALVAQQVVSLADTLPDRAEVSKDKVAAEKEWVAGEGKGGFGAFDDSSYRYKRLGQ